jgi:hypothetical protein
MKRLTTTICLTIAMLLGSAGVSFALPECAGSPLIGSKYDVASWDGCEGTHTFGYGEKYVGEYRNGKPNGQFTVTYANGDKYVGEFRDGKRNGQGTYTWAKSGNKYVGEYRNGKKKQGTYTWAKSGNKYVGEWRNGKKNGLGTLTFASGRIKEGIWKDNKFQYVQGDQCPKGTVEDMFNQRCVKDPETRVTPPVIAKRKPRSTPRRRTTPRRRSNSNKVISASSGSGFAVSSNGHVVTNHHVIKGCQKVKIHDKGKSIAATVVTYDPRNDLALLKGNFRPSAVLSLSADSPEILQDVYVAGYPFGRKVSTSIKVTRGIISSLTGIGNNFSQIQIDAALQPGNSGGPILDDKGNVVGVAVSRLDKIKALKKFGSLPENTNFGVKTSVVRSILESSNVSIPKANRSSISKSKLGKMISGGTYYLSCWMTTAQIEKMRSKKVIFQNLD